MVTIAEEDPLQPDIRTLIAHSDEYSAQRYPAEERSPFGVEALAQGHVRFVVARIRGVAVGCCALFMGGDGTGELKRLIVAPEARGQGAGRALLSAIEVIARREQVTTIRLETGPLNTEALVLYRANGYRETGPFGDHQSGPSSTFFEKMLDG